MNKYLTELFNYTHWANCKLLESIKQLPQKEEAIALFSHMIAAQDKWMNRITKEVEDATLAWNGVVFPLEELEPRWTKSYKQWVDLLKSGVLPLENEIVFIRAADKKAMKVRLQDIMLQLNYHSIHHRAQINKLISAQGMAPPATDYIFTAIKEA